MMLEPAYGLLPGIGSVEGGAYGNGRSYCQRREMSIGAPSKEKAGAGFPACKMWTLHVSVHRMVHVSANDIS